MEDGKEIDEDTRIKARERERQRAMQNLEPRMFFIILNSDLLYSSV